MKYTNHRLLFVSVKQCKKDVLPWVYIFCFLWATALWAQPTSAKQRDDVDRKESTAEQATLFLKAYQTLYSLETSEYSAYEPQTLLRLLFTAKTLSMEYNLLGWHTDRAIEDSCTMLLREVNSIDPQDEHCLLKKHVEAEILLQRGLLRISLGTEFMGSLDLKKAYGLLTELEDEQYTHHKVALWYYEYGITKLSTLSRWLIRNLGMGNDSDQAKKLLYNVMSTADSVHLWEYDFLQLISQNYLELPESSLFQETALHRLQNISKAIKNRALDQANTTLYALDTAVSEVYTQYFEAKLASIREEYSLADRLYRQYIDAIPKRGRSYWIARYEQWQNAMLGDLEHDRNAIEKNCPEYTPWGKYILYEIGHVNMRVLEVRALFDAAKYEEILMLPMQEMLHTDERLLYYTLLSLLELEREDEAIQIMRQWDRERNPMNITMYFPKAVLKMVSTLETLDLEWKLSLLKTTTKMYGYPYDRTTKNRLKHWENILTEQAEQEKQ